MSVNVPCSEHYRKVTTSRVCGLNEVKCKRWIAIINWRLILDANHSFLYLFSKQFKSVQLVNDHKLPNIQEVNLPWERLTLTVSNSQGEKKLLVIIDSGLNDMNHASEIKRGYSTGDHTRPPTDKGMNEYCQCSIWLSDWESILIHVSNFLSRKTFWWQLLVKGKTRVCF